MLAIQNFFKNLYGGIQDRAKRACRDCAVLMSGFSIFALISLNVHGLGDRGRFWAAEECLSFRREDGESAGENPWQSNALAGGNFALVCKNVLDGDQERLIRESREKLRKIEQTEVCASVETMYSEVRKDPVNRYGEIQVSPEDYEALCRIVQAEAGGEDETGKRLVAEVVLNRVLSDGFASTVYGVVFERVAGRAQFSPTADGRYYTVEVTEGTVEAVEKALHGEDYSQGALFFSARSKADPYDMAWFDRNLKWLFQYGGHEFYALP